MIRAFLMAIAVLFSAPAAAQKCLPRSLFPGAAGTDYLFVETDMVEGRVGWCPDNSSGTQWTIEVYQWSMKKYLITPVNPFRVIDQLRAASIPLQAASAVAAQFSRPLSADERPHYAVWRWQACKKLTTPPFTLGVQFDPFPVDYCGSQPPDPSSPPAEKWIVTPSGTATYRPAFPVVAGKRSSISDNEAATRSACDCSIKFVELGGLVTYCLATSLKTATSVPHVTACVKQP